MLNIKWKARLENIFISFNFHKNHQIWFGIFVSDIIYDVILED